MVKAKPRINEKTMDVLTKTVKAGVKTSNAKPKPNKIQEEDIPENLRPTRSRSRSRTPTRVIKTTEVILTLPTPQPQPKPEVVKRERKPYVKKVAKTDGVKKEKRVRKSSAAVVLENKVALKRLDGESKRGRGRPASAEKITTQKTVVEKEVTVARRSRQSQRLSTATAYSYQLRGRGRSGINNDTTDSPILVDYNDHESDGENNSNDVSTNDESHGWFSKCCIM